MAGHVKKRLRSICFSLIFLTVAFSFACQKKNADANATSGRKAESTKALQAADLVGYDGTRLRKSVDNIRQSNQKHDQQLDKMAEGGPDN